MKTIKELVLSAKNGNKKAFDKLYKLTSNDCLLYTSRCV